MLKCLVDLSNYYLLFLHKSLYFYCFYFEFQDNSVNLFQDKTHLHGQVFIGES